MAKEKLLELTTTQVENSARIIRDCIRLIETTGNPETRASRLHLLQEQLVSLEQLNEYLGNRYTDVLRNAQDVLRDH